MNRYLLCDFIRNRNIYSTILKNVPSKSCSFNFILNKCIFNLLMSKEINIEQSPTNFEKNFRRRSKSVESESFKKTQQQSSFSHF